MRVLLIKTSSMGDLIHCLPALTDAKQALPAVRFDWVAEEGFAQIPSWHPAVEQVLPVAVRRWRKRGWPLCSNEQWRAFKRQVRQTDYDLVIDAQGLLKSAWLARVSSGSIAGFNRHSAREPLSAWFYQRRFFVDKHQHAIDRLRQLFAQALNYPLPRTAPDYGLSRQAFIQEPSAAPYLLFLHGTTWPSKHWPEPFWRPLLEQINEQGQRVCLPFGNAQEQARAQRLARGLECVEVLPPLNLVGMAQTIAGARACVAVDSGLGHLAAALSVPCLSLYGPTLPARVGTLGAYQRHLCASGANAGKGDRDKPCFDSLSPAQVGQALQQLLDKSA